LIIVRRRTSLDFASVILLKQSNFFLQPISRAISATVMIAPAAIVMAFRCMWIITDDSMPAAADVAAPTCRRIFRRDEHDVNEICRYAFASFSWSPSSLLWPAAAPSAIAIILVPCRWQNSSKGKLSCFDGLHNSENAPTPDDFGGSCSVRILQDGILACAQSG
jgi:hypothetical protein